MGHFALFSLKVWAENRGFRHHVFVKTSPKEVQLAEVGPRFELKRAFQGVFMTTDFTHLFPQPMKYGRAQLSNPRLSESGYSRIIRERQESAACCQILGHPVQTTMDKPIPDLPRSGPADIEVAGHKSILLVTVISMVYIQEVNLL